MRLKNSLSMPIRTLASCVSEVKGKKLCAKRRNKRCRGGGSRGGWTKFGKPPPPRAAHPKDLSLICSYQTELEKERQVMLCVKSEGRLQIL